MDPSFDPLVLFGMGLLCVGFIYATWRINRERLFTTIIVFLLLIAIAGAKLTTLFGHETNVGNIFYASVFLATYLLIERYGKKAGFRSIPLGVGFVVFVVVLLQLVVVLSGSGDSSAFDSALALVFGFSPRLALASLSGYACAQTLNVFLYAALKERWDGRLVWLRVNLANAVAQVLDSIIFFSVAFLGTVPSGNILDIIATGYLLKVACMALAAPLLYLNTVEEDEDQGFFTLKFLR